MSRQFSIPTVLRMVPNDQLQEFFQRLGHGDLDIPWQEMGEREVGPMIKAIGGLTPHDQDKVEAELRSVFDLACESGTGAIFEAAINCGDLSMPASMPHDTGPYAKAMWAWLNRPEAFSKATLIHQVEHLSWWRQRNDLPIAAPDMSEAAKESLQRQISDLLTWEQGRGQVCTVETFSRADGTDYFFAYPDDFAQNIMAHDDDEQLAPRTFRQTFIIVFAFRRAEGTLELFARVPAKLKTKLEAVFARAILGVELGAWNPDAAFELNHLKNSTFKLETDAHDRLQVGIRRMRLALKSSGRRLWVEVDIDEEDDNIHKALEECLNREHVPLSGVHITQVTFCFEFLPLDGRKPGRTTFDVSFPSSCGLRNERAERVDLIHKYLKRWNIDRGRSPELALAAAGG